MSDELTVKELLTALDDMQLIELHSYVRNQHPDQMVWMSEILIPGEGFDPDISLDFEIDGSKLMLLAGIELSKRNLN